MAQIIDGKLISQQIKDELKEKVASLKNEGKEICLAVIQVGNDPASTVYVGNKKIDYTEVETAFEIDTEKKDKEPIISSIFIDAFIYLLIITDIFVLSTSALFNSFNNSSFIFLAINSLDLFKACEI